MLAICSSLLAIWGTRLRSDMPLKMRYRSAIEYSTTLTKQGGSMPLDEQTLSERIEAFLIRKGVIRIVG